MLLAARGQRETEAGMVAIEAPALVARIRAVARGIHGKTLAAAVVLTGLVAACPA